MNRKLTTVIIGGIFALLAFVPLAASAGAHATPTVLATEVTTDGGLEWG